MGLFDKKTKRNDGFDNGSEKLKVPSNGADDDHVSTPMPVAEVPSAAARSSPAPVPATPLQRDHPDYGINKAIELMRMLPDDNMELIVCVVKTTLESANVNVKTIIEDAIRKQGVLETRIGTLARQIETLEAEVAVRKREIASLEADFKETSTVKDWLLVAETANAPAAGSAKDALLASSPAVAASGAEVDAKK